MSLFGMAYKGLSGMTASQISLDVVGQNIANMNNPDYSKQTANVVTSKPIYTTVGSIGTGVTVENITRSYNDTLQVTVRNEASAYMMFATMSYNLESAMLYFNELEQGSGLGDSMKDYFDAWSSLANSAADDTDEALIKRQQLLESAETLSLKIREGYASIEQTIASIDESIAQDVSEINELVKNIAQLNDDIAKAEAAGGFANDLRDLRDSLIDDISEKANVTVTHEDNGQVTVLVGSQLAVDGGSYHQFETQVDEESGELEIFWTSRDFLADPINLTETINGGSIAGSVNSREDLQVYLKQLDELATTMITETNKIHASGQGLERFSSVTGTNGVENPTYALDSEYGSLGSGQLEEGSFRITIYNEDGGIAAVHDIHIDPSVDNMLSIEQKINASLAEEGSGGLNANNQSPKLTADLTTNNSLSLNVTPGYTIAFGEDTTGFLAATGINGFFSGSSAKDIDVSSLIKDNVEYIATGTTGAIGDNTNAKAISALQFEDIESLDGVVIGEFYGVFIGQFAIDKSQVDTYAATRKMTFEQLYGQQQSIRGVSEQEELLDLSLYQRIFEANSRFINVVDEMLNTIINSLGA